MDRQPAPDVTKADVERVVARDYQPDEQAEALAILREYGTDDGHRETDRVQLAALKLAAGSLARLRLEVEAAKTDYRDVIAPAEYPGYIELRPSSEVVSLQKRVQIIYDDWEQYQQWLTR